MSWFGGWFGPEVGGGTATYDPTGHPLLSPAAKALESTDLDAQAVAAEALLRRGPTALADTAFAAGTPEYTRAVLAVVYQVNYQLAAGVDAEVFKSLSRGERSMTYRDSMLVSPRAQEIVDRLIPLVADTAAWPIAGGLR